MDRILKMLTITAAAMAAQPAIAGTAPQGEAVFQSQCSTCHSLKPNGPGIGPSLFGVVGRKAGSQPHFAYSAAMKSAGFVWTPARLEAYLAAPQKVVPGDRMPYPGLKDPKQLAALIAYLETVK